MGILMQGLQREIERDNLLQTAVEQMEGGFIGITVPGEDPNSIDGITWGTLARAMQVMEDPDVNPFVARELLRFLEAHEPHAPDEARGKPDAVWRESVTAKMRAAMVAAGIDPDGLNILSRTPRNPIARHFDQSSKEVTKLNAEYERLCAEIYAMVPANWSAQMKAEFCSDVGTYSFGQFIYRLSSEKISTRRMVHPHSYACRDHEEVREFLEALKAAWRGIIDVEITKHSSEECYRVTYSLAVCAEVRDEAAV